MLKLEPSKENACQAVAVERVDGPPMSQKIVLIGISGCFSWGLLGPTFQGVQEAMFTLRQTAVTHVLVRNDTVESLLIQKKCSAVVSEVSELRRTVADGPTCKDEEAKMVAVNVEHGDAKRFEDLLRTLKVEDIERTYPCSNQEVSG